MDKGCNYSRIEIALYNNINVYKIDRGKSVRVRSTGYCQFKKKIPRLVGRLWSGVRISVSFQMFALTAGGMS